MHLYCKICRKETIQLANGMVELKEAVQVEYYNCMICGTTNYTILYKIINLLKYLNNSYFNNDIKETV